jgi:hypothetical protein
VNIRSAPASENRFHDKGGYSIVSSIALSGIVFACVLGSSMAAMIVRRFLPDNHLDAESRDVVKLGMGLIATLAALVLGLLIATAKGTYDAQSSLINEISASYVLLDRGLARYGPETKECRDLLKSNVAGTLDRIWPQDSAQPANLAPGGEGKTAGETLFDKVGELAPKTDAQRELRARALGIMTDIAQARLRLFARQDSALPLPFLLVLVFWLSILFAGYGLLTRANPTVVVVLIVCTLSVSGAIFLMLELATPFAGTMRISSAPMHHALSLLGQ